MKSSVEQSEEQVSTQATDDTVKYDASTLHPESSQSDSTLECEPMDAESKYCFVLFIVIILPKSHIDFLPKSGMSLQPVMTNPLQRKKTLKSLLQSD